MQPAPTVNEYSQSPFRGRGSLRQVVDELQRQVHSRLDFTADTTDMAIRPGSDGAFVLAPANDNLLDWLPKDGLPCLPQAALQVAERCGVPHAGEFLRKSGADHPNRVADFLTGILHDRGENRLVRCLDGRVRAFLSDRYRVIDSLSVASRILEQLQKANGRVLEASITDSHLRIKAISAEVWDTIEHVRTADPSGRWYAGGLGNQEFLSRVAARRMDDLPLHGGKDTVWPIATFRNSETGQGGFGFDGGILRAICFNLATVEHRLVEVHLGSRLETGVYSADTIQKEAAAIYAKVADLVTAFFTPEEFRKLVDQVRPAAQRRVQRPAEAVRLLVEDAAALREGDLDALVGYFMQEDSTLFGLGQAVARLAQDVAEAERAEEVEWLAGQVLTGAQDRVLAPAFATA